MSVEPLVNQARLAEWTGYSRRADILRFLEDHGVDYWLTRSGDVVTTLKAIERRLIEREEDFVFEFE